MSRSIKEGLDYFSLDTTSDRKWKLIKSKYGLWGVGLLVELLKTIYAENYFYKWDEESVIIFAGDNNINEEDVNNFIEFAVKHGFFSDYMLKTYGVLTSSGIQKRYFEACWRRKKVVCYQELMLTEPEKPEWSKTEIIKSSINNINVIGKEENVIGKEEKYSKNSQSKVKESKVNINTAKPEPDGSDNPENLPAKKETGLSRLKDDVANYWQELFIYHQPHTTWSNYGQERGQLSTLAKKTRAFLKTSPYTDEYEVAKNIFDMFLYMRQHSKDKRIRESPIIPSRVSMFWSDITTALAERYHSEEQAARYDDVEVPL
jgi:hypothetical protein